MMLSKHSDKTFPQSLTQSLMAPDSLEVHPTDSSISCSTCNSACLLMFPKSECAVAVFALLHVIQPSFYSCLGDAMGVSDYNFGSYIYLQTESR